MSSMRLTQLHDAYLRDRAALGMSPLTIAAYRSDFKILEEFLGTDDIRGLRSPKCQEYVLWLTNRPAQRTRGAKGHSPRGILRRLASASAFCRWLVRRKDLPANPFEDVPKPKQPRRFPRAVPVAWVDAMLALTGISPRDRAIVTILRYAGLRISEVAGLDVEDCGVVLRVVGKGDKERVVPIHPKVKESLTLLTGVRGDGPGPLFTNPAGDRLGRRGVYRIIVEMARQANVPSFTPHQLRHTFTTEMLERLPLHKVQELLGHADPATTALYAKPAAEDLRRACEAVWAVKES